MSRRTPHYPAAGQARRFAPSGRVFRWWDYPLFLLLTGSSVSAIAYFLSYWFSRGDWIGHPAVFSILTLMLLATLLNNQAAWFLLPLMRKPGPPGRPSSWKVAVVTTFVRSAESIEMLAESVEALTALDYPHDTWVLDEGNSDEVRTLCRRLGAHHFSRKDLPQYQTESGPFQAGSKYGNYNAWLQEIGFGRYDIVTGFDPDHVPDSDFLSQVLGYFEDPRVAYVQVAQAYYNQQASFVARGAAEETYDFYSSVAMTSYGMGYAILIGAHNTQRLSALKQVGGYPAHDAEDLLLALHYRNLGWRGVYVPKIAARGLTPVDWQAYLQQQRRWARSLLDVRWRGHPTLSAAPSLKTRAINLLEGVNYLRRSLVILTSLALLAYMLASGTAPRVVSFATLPRLAVLVGVLQLCRLYRQRFYLDWRREWGMHWRAGVLQMAKWPYILLALWDVMAGRQVGYAITRKIAPASATWTLLGPHLFVIAVVGAAWVVGLASAAGVSPMVQIGALVTVAGSLALIASERLSVQAPYRRDPGLGRRHS